MSAPKVITPTVGRVLWYWREPPADASYANNWTPTQPEAATVAYVHHSKLVNLSVTGSDGRVRPETSVTLRQPGEPMPEGSFAEWMPYQMGQAAKTEELEQRAKAAPNGND